MTHSQFAYQIFSHHWTNERHMPYKLGLEFFRTSFHKCRDRVGSFLRVHFFSHLRIPFGDDDFLSWSILQIMHGLNPTLELGPHKISGA